MIIAPSQILKKIRGENTIIIGNEAVAAQIKNTTILRPWQSITIQSVSIKPSPPMHQMTLATRWQQAA